MLNCYFAVNCPEPTTAPGGRSPSIFTLCEIIFQIVWFQPLCRWQPVFIILGAAWVRFNNQRIQLNNHRYIIIKVVTACYLSFMEMFSIFHVLQLFMEMLAVASRSNDAAGNISARLQSVSTDLQSLVEKHIEVDTFLWIDFFITFIWVIQEIKFSSQHHTLKLTFENVCIPCFTGYNSWSVHLHGTALPIGLQL